MNDIIALGITFILSILWLRINDFAAERGWISGRLSRKIIHIGTGPLYVLCWLLFSPAPTARYLAAAVPLLITVQFFLVGVGVIKDEAAVQAMSRTGDPSEILRGPLIYGLVFVVLTIWFWKDSPVGMVALMLLCGGDGLADIVGRRWDKHKLPWNQGKTWTGSLGMLVGGWLLAVLILGTFVTAGVFPGPWNAYMSAITWIALAGTVVESIPTPDIDNLTITVAAVALGLLLF
jgi:phytol kinase